MMICGRSVNQKIIASIMNKGCGTINKPHNHSKAKKDLGHPSQNGNEAQSETPSQMTDRKPKNRALGLPTVCFMTQPPPWTMCE